MRLDITARELLGIAKKYNLLDDRLRDIEEFIRASGGGLAMCATCEIRKTSRCPWPNQSAPTMQVCNDYKKKENE